MESSVQLVTDILFTLLEHFFRQEAVSEELQSEVELELEQELELELLQSELPLERHSFTPHKTGVLPQKS